MLSLLTNDLSVKKKLTAGLTAAVVMHGVIVAQNTTSPYSVYGIGDIDFRSYNRTSGMGNTGLALPSSYYLIDNNPAAITGLTRSFYLVNASAVGRSVQYAGTPVTSQNSHNQDFWIKRFGLAVKINKCWASALGLRQFSNINYKFTGSKAIEGSGTQYLTDNTGDGGLNEYYWTNAFSLGKHFSLGLQSSIIAGSVNKTETLSDEALATTITTTQQDYYGQARYQAGVLYSTAVGKKMDFSLGAKYIPRVNMVANRTLNVMENTTAIVTNEALKDGSFYLPKTWAGGLALKFKKKTTFAVDYTYEDWSSPGIKGQGWQMINSQRISAGLEFSKQKMILNQPVEQRYFQVGGFFNNSSLEVRNQPIREFGLTAGMGGALNSSLLYNLALEAGRRGTTQASLIRENYIQLTIGLSFRDFLFSKGKKYN